MPEKRAGRPPGRGTEVPVTERGEPGAAVTGSAGDLGRLELERVQTDEARRFFRELVGRYHYLGYAVPFGAHLQYLVYATAPERRVVGCIQFSSAAWRIAVRDAWIGWDSAGRVRNLTRVVNNSRFLLLPWVQVKNLASRVLSKAARRMVGDWEQQYRVEPVLMETLVDPRWYRGTCYRAANWIELGRTRGLGRRGRRAGEPVTPKTVLVYPLVRDAAQRLREG